MFTLQFLARTLSISAVLLLCLKLNAQSTASDADAIEDASASVKPSELTQPKQPVKQTSQVKPKTNEQKISSQSAKSNDPATSQPLQSSSAPFGQTINHRTPFLVNQSTRSYSHIHWQAKPGNGMPITLLPTVNATGKTTYSTSDRTGQHDGVEIRTVPDNLHYLINDLVRNSNFLEPTGANEVIDTDFAIQFHLIKFDTLYSLANNNNALSLGVSKLDNWWSKAFGENKPATVGIVMTIYDRQHNLLLEAPIQATLDPCHRTDNPMVFVPSRHQQFLNQFAQTTIGQTSIAAINRALEVAAQYFQHQPIEGKVVRVNNNEVYLNFGQNAVRKADTVELIIDPGNEFPSYSAGELIIEDVWHNVSLAYPISIKSGSIIPGDIVRMASSNRPHKFISVAESKVECPADHNQLASNNNSEKRTQQPINNMATTAEQNTDKKPRHWTW
ncbi:MAG: hypothetical protein V2I33_09895 [Kangiellaceae bacterium]|jgi:hypothetical protein|nr:hypothetical protein [Kangiellaceae bacterium]